MQSRTSSHPPRRHQNPLADAVQLSRICIWTKCRGAFFGTTAGRSSSPLEFYFWQIGICEYPSIFPCSVASFMEFAERSLCLSKAPLFKLLIVSCCPSSVLAGMGERTIAICKDTVGWLLIRTILQKSQSITFRIPDPVTIENQCQCLPSHPFSRLDSQNINNIHRQTTFNRSTPVTESIYLTVYTKCSPIPPSFAGQSMFLPGPTSRLATLRSRPNIIVIRFPCPL